MSFTRILLFLVVLAVIVGGGHYYLWTRLVRDTQLPMPWSRVATGLLFVLPVLTLVGQVLGRGPRGAATPLAWLAYVWMGTAFFLLLGVLAADLFRVALRVAALVNPGLDDPGRRLFFHRVLGAGAALTGLGLAAGGMASALGTTTIEKVKITLRGLGKERSGYRIVQISDIHVGPTIGKEFMDRLVARINALEPDMIAITGDLVDGSVAHLGPFVAPLGELKARDGVFFVTGNHEYYSGVDPWLLFLGSLGIRVLRNERVAVGGDAGFDLAGVDDASAHRFGKGHGADLERALHGRDEARAVVLLAHQPRAALEAAERGVQLVLSGHTHGGQMFPWHHAVKLQQPFVAGLHRHKDTQVYVSRGTGYWGPPMRVSAPAEITEIELVAG